MRIYTLSYQLKALAEEKWKRKSNLLFSLELEHCFAFTLVNLYQWPQFLRPLVLNWAIPTAYLILQTAYCRTYIVTYVNFHNTFILIYQSIYLSIINLSSIYCFYVSGEPWLIQHPHPCAKMISFCHYSF
jgi:hypothetical protein